MQKQPQNPDKYGVYVRSILNTKLALNITEIGRNLSQNLENLIRLKYEGKCISEGFIRPNTVRVLSYSSGLVKDDHVEFCVVYECLVCYPVKDMVVKCTVSEVTKAGLHAFVKDFDSDNIPITVFIARDHHSTSPYFSSIKENAVIEARIIGVRFELNDPSITTIASLIEKKHGGAAADIDDDM
jgi:DNA-directed RNA polymerase subunit E'/Rpb7